MDDDNPVPVAGMVISVQSRHDVVVVDPERLLAAARAAYLDEHPGATDAQAAEHCVTVYDAAHILLDRYGTLASDDPAVAAGGSERHAMHGGTGHRPGDRVLGRADGLSPAGSISEIVLGEPMPLQDYGCFLPSSLFTARRRDSS